MIDKVKIPAPIIEDRVFLMRKADHANVHIWNIEDIDEESNDNAPKMEKNSTWNETDTQWKQGANGMEISLSLVRVS